MRPIRRYLIALLAVAAIAGCSTLPDEGPVTTRADRDASNQAPYFAPVGPNPGGDRTAIVNGFLLAIQANPPTTAVARAFLTDRAKAVWKPDQGTVVYDSSAVVSTGTGIRLRLTGAHLLDQRGAWLGGSTPVTVNLPLTLVKQEGEWRIANPPSALPVPASYFRSLYQPYTLYFFDRTGTVLVPSRIYVPRGEQIASTLVRGVLAGPSAQMAAWAQGAFAPGAGLTGSVATNEDGVVEIPLGPEIQRLAGPELNRLVVQLVRVLRQVPGITRLRLTSNGIAVALPGGRTEVGLSGRLDFDPISAPSDTVVGISGDRVVRIDDQVVVPAGGPLGQPGFALRSVAYSGSRDEYAAVAGNGQQVFLAADSGSTEATRVRTVLSGAANLLRPVYDRFGGLWAVDAAPAGAVVHLIKDGRDRVVQVDGISGRRISSITVTRDGARLVAGSAATTGTSILVADLVRAAPGRLVRALPARRVSVSGIDLGTVLDVAQDGGTTAAVLTRSASGTRRVISVELDGSPGSRSTPADPVPDQLVSLVAGPDPNLPLRAIATGGRLLELGGTGQWVRIASDVFTAGYAQ